MKTVNTKEIAPQEGEAKAKQLIQLKNKFKGNSRGDQAMRLREALRKFSVSTLEARRYLDIMHPAGRVQELRENGDAIDTLRLSQTSEIGRPHCVAVYVLREEGRA